FDFDKTITVCDTILPISRYLCEQLKRKNKFRIVQLYFLLFRMNFISSKSFKEKIVTTLLKGLNSEQIEKTILKFYQENYSNLLNGKIVEQINSEKQKGNYVIIITSNIQLFVNPIKKLLDVNDVFATQVEVADKIIGEKIVGENCSGKVKAEILNKCKQKYNPEKVIAYGDSKGDFDMLNNADEGYLLTYSFKDALSKFLYRINNIRGKIPNQKFQILIKKYKDKNISH
ncbi:MAG: HAD family hydrolase, partial [Ignavibacterium sp.]